MSLLIDGYNLLHVTGIIGGGVGPGTLKRARNALLNYLANSLESSRRARTTVVFDAKSAPGDVPAVTDFKGITVHFAMADAEADDLIERLIRHDSAPRQLLVVSSDHRIQKAARRRRATAVDSDVWYEQLSRRSNRQPRQETTAEMKKTTGKLADDEVRRWLDEFGFVDDDDPNGTKNERRSSNERAAPQDQAHWHPFPPGYGEDLLNDQS